MAGTLYIVATPIGNLEDISKRAIDTLRSADLIACEDTRHTGKLLKELGISAKLVSYHDHNEAESAGLIGNALSEGLHVAIVSDAGSPAIADPGFRAVNKAMDVGAQIRAVPGASALVAALSVSGLPTDSFFFGGFLPSRKGERRSRLRELSDLPSTLVLYEAPHRIAASLSDCHEILGDRKACLARELTKLHEEHLRGRLSDILEDVSETPRKGEMVLVIDRARDNEIGICEPGQVTGRYRELLASGVDSKKALKTVAKEFGIARSEAYRQIHIGE